MMPGMQSIVEDHLDKAQETKSIRKEFELYQANMKDQTYMGNWSNFEKWSVSLIISQKNMKQI